MILIRLRQEFDTKQGQNSKIKKWVRTKLQRDKSDLALILSASLRTNSEMQIGRQ